MESYSSTSQTRRSFLRACLAVPVALVLAACARQAARSGSSATTTQPTSVLVAAASPSPQPSATEAAQSQALQPTPACTDDDDITPSQTEGPYYTPDTPERTSLIEPGITGTKLVVAGSVLTTNCTPVARALVDFWQADSDGKYDNVGYRLRGHQFTDDQGRYSLETIVPGLYPGRTRHIHVKVQAPNQPILTTQLYFPNEPHNDTDGIFHQDLVMDVQDSGDSRAATFDFVLDMA